jgi:hypothetical protein
MARDAFTQDMVQVKRENKSKPAKKPFCGAGKVPKNKKRGTVVECANTGQIRYYGVKKVGKNTMQKVKHLKKGNRQKLQALADKLNKSIRKGNKKLETMEDGEKKTKLLKSLEKKGMLYREATRKLTEPPKQKPKNAKPNTWLDHVKKFRTEHPEIKSYKEVLKRAKETYKKGGEASSAPAPQKKTP